MNFIIARIMKILQNEEEVFWVFAMLIETILPIDFYTHMAGVHTDTKLFSFYIKQYLPLISEKFESLNFDPMFFSVNWFVCLFTDKLDENVRIQYILTFLDFNRNFRVAFSQGQSYFT